MSKLPLRKLSSILCITITKLLLLLSHSILKSIIRILPEKSWDEYKNDRNNKIAIPQTELKLYEYNGELFSLEEIADLIMMDQKRISERLRNGESLSVIVENPTLA